MGSPRRAPVAELDDAELEAIADEVELRVHEEGALPRSAIAPSSSRATQAALAAKLARRGLEVKPKVVRVAVADQLEALLDAGPAPVAGLERRLRGGATRAETRAALGALVAKGAAVVLRGKDAQGTAARPPRDLIDAGGRSRLAAIAKALAALAKAPGKNALAPRARWDDVRALLAGLLDGAGATPIDERLLGALRSAADRESGISAIGDAVKHVEGGIARDAVADALRRLAARGAIELRIASQPHLVPDDVRPLCPTDPGGRLLAYARVLGG
jgi:hypothetical protein